MTAVRQFVAPNSLRVVYDKGPVKGFGTMGVPVRPGVSRVFARFAFKQPAAQSPLMKLLSKLPHWTRSGQTPLADQDTVVNSKQVRWLVDVWYWEQSIPHHKLRAVVLLMQRIVMCMVRWCMLHQSHMHVRCDRVSCAADTSTLYSVVRNVRHSAQGSFTKQARAHMLSQVLFVEATTYMVSGFACWLACSIIMSSVNPAALWYPAA